MPRARSPPFQLCSTCRVSLAVPPQSSCLLTSHPLSGAPQFSWSLLLDLLHLDARIVLVVYIQWLLVESMIIFLFCDQVAHSIVLLLYWKKVLKYKSCSPLFFFSLLRARFHILGLFIFQRQGNMGKIKPDPDKAQPPLSSEPYVYFTTIRGIQAPLQTG